ncbi:hypothetical protein [Fibrivirga algicola]|uniref:Uncharacterized protein n=1 Tax=Fibrivirga algicola TaxID=2950420 RepID=A0ABX0QDT2_9BACT|nr:hypothetical protein [Fibrivirga algicola]NID09411.1 hypothetical protein [Fibrivirga algicola]
MAREVITYGNVTKGKLSIVERAQFLDSLGNWQDCEVELIVKKIEPHRSNPANRYYWGVVVKIARQVINLELGEYYSRDKIHEMLKAECNTVEHDTQSGRMVMVVRDTHDMPHSEFCEYVERCRFWLLNFWGADTPDPVKILTTKDALPI